MSNIFYTAFFFSLGYGACLLNFSLQAADSTQSSTISAKPMKPNYSATNSTSADSRSAPNIEANRDQSQMAAWMIEAAQAAKDYVETIDKGLYAQSWSRGDSLFQQTISQKEWATALQGARKPLGKVLSRTLKDQRPAWDPRGLPKGPYMVIEYNTSFEKAPQSGELLTLRMGPDGRWRVLTYQVN